MAILKAKVTADIADFTNKMNGVKFSAKSASDYVKGAFVTIAGATLGLGVAALRTALIYEDLGKRMQTIFGQEEGQKFFDEISKFAAKSAADTESLVRSATIVAGIMGTKEKPEFYEGIVFAAKQMNKTVLEGSTLIGKFFKKLQTGGKVDAEILLQLGQVFGPEFIDRVRNGTVTYEEAMDKFKSRAVEMAKIWGVGLGGEINKLGGAWQDFLKRIGEGKNLEAVQRIFKRLSDILTEVADSGVLEELSDGFGDMVAAIDMDDVKTFLSAALEIMKAMTWLLAKMIKHWKIIVPLVVAYKLAMIAASVAQAKTALLGGGGGIGGKAGGLAKAAGPVAAVAATAYIGYKTGQMLGEKLGDAMFGPKEGETYRAAPTKAERERFRLEKKARLAAIAEAKTITGKDDFTSE